MKEFILCAALLSQAAAYGQTEVSDTVSVQHLNEVTVSGERPQVRGKAGVMTVDLPDIIKDKAVTNILEALVYLPGATNNNGNICLTGASDVTIIVNGEVTNMPQQNLYQLLYTTPVDRLKNVEIMYSAPAKYHVNGAVINVVLNPPRLLDGLQGQVRAGYNHSHYSSYGGAVAATYSIRDLTFDLNYGLSRTNAWSREETWSNHLFKGERIMIEDNVRHTDRNWNNTIHACAGWKTLKLTYNGQIITGSKRQNRSSGTLGAYTNDINALSPIGFHNISVRYSAPSGVTVGGDYTQYSERRSQSLFKGDDYRQGADNTQNIKRYHFYVDRQHQSGKLQLNYGAEYQRSDDRSSQHYHQSEEGDFDEAVNEDVASVYVGIQGSFDRGLSFNVSAKGEYFHNKYQHNWSVIPQIGSTYYRTPKSIFQLNLSTRRIYPAYWELHGGTSYHNEYAKVTGNSGLQPYIQYDAQFNYIFNHKYVATLYFQYGDNATVQLPYQSRDALNLIYQTINMNYKRVVGLNLHVPFGIGYIWEARAAANVFNQREKAERFHDISFDNSKWIFYGSLNNSFKFSQDFPVSLSVDFSYITPSVQGISDLSSLWKVDAGVKWQFGKNGCSEFVLKADDIFNTWTPTMTINHAGQDYRMKVRDMTRNFKITYILRFNGFKAKGSGIDTSRFGTGNK